MIRFLRAVACFSVLLFAAQSLPAQWDPSNPITGFQRQSDGITFTRKSGTMKLLV